MTLAVAFPKIRSVLPCGAAPVLSTHTTLPKPPRTQVNHLTVIVVLQLVCSPWALQGYSVRLEVILGLLRQAIIFIVYVIYLENLLINSLVITRILQFLECLTRCDLLSFHVHVKLHLFLPPHRAVDRSTDLRAGGSVISNTRSPGRTSCSTLFQFH